MPTFAFMPQPMLRFLPPQVHLLSTSNPSKAPQLVQRRIAGLEYFISHHEGQLIILTNAHGAVNYQLMTTPVHQPSLSNWRPLVPEREGVALRDLEVFATHAVLHESHSMKPGVSLLSLPACPETVSLLPQKQVAPPIYARSQSCADDQQDLHENLQQAGQAETQLLEHDTQLLQSQQTSREQQSDSLPCEQRAAQQQQNNHPELDLYQGNKQQMTQQHQHQQHQHQQHHPEPDLHQHIGLGNKQRMTQQHSQQQQQQQQQQQCCPQGDQQLLQSVPAHLQTIAIPPWVMSIEAGANLDHHSTTVRLKMASPVHPQHVYDYHLDSGQLQLLAVATVGGHDPEEYVCQVHYASSHDGAQVWQVSQLAEKKQKSRRDQWTDWKAARRCLISALAWICACTQSLLKCCQLPC